MMLSLCFFKLVISIADTMHVQASGEAICTLDQPQSKEGLWAVYIASTQTPCCFPGVGCDQRQPCRYR